MTSQRWDSAVHVNAPPSSACRRLPPLQNSCIRSDLRLGVTRQRKQLLAMNKEHECGSAQVGGRADLYKRESCCVAVWTGSRSKG